MKDVMALYVCSGGVKERKKERKQLSSIPEDAMAGADIAL